jgi:hypothetical protein
MTDLSEQQTQLPVVPTREGVPTRDGTSQCPNCRAAIAADQSYCLSCGARQPRARTPVGDGRANNGSAPADRSAPTAPPPRDWTLLATLGGLAALALVFVVGILIGRDTGNNAPKVAASPQVITVAGGAGAGTSATGAGSATAASSITEDWPAGKSAWTVQLQTLPKSSATASSVTAAKSAASSKGATGVGLLDAANYKTIGSDYIIYSGVYDSQAKAQAALAKLKGSFPSAKVIHVVPSGGGGGGGATATTSSGGVAGGVPTSSAQQAAGNATINRIQSACANGATKQCSQATKNTGPIATPGAPPPRDNRPAGGGSGGAQTFQ